jgi:hypothetical protein
MAIVIISEGKNLFEYFTFKLIYLIEANLNICDWIYCANGGKCLNTGNSTTSYKCRCDFGFTGMLCEDRVNITSNKFFISFRKFKFS